MSGALAITPRAGWFAAAAVAGPVRATDSLLAALRAGKTSDDWIGSFSNDDTIPPLADTLKLWEGREILSSEAFAALSDELKGQAGRLVGVWHTSFTEAIYASLRRAIAEGMTLADWMPHAQQLLDGFGAAGGERIYSGDTWSAWYADLVFRNANAAAYAGGRYAEMFSAAWIVAAPYWIYDAIKDARTRPTHAALDGIVFRKTDPGARRLLAPLGHNCRCVCRELDQDDLEAGGYKVTTGAKAPAGPDDGWEADRVASLVPAALRRAA